MPLNGFAQTLTVAGKIISVDPGRPSFSLTARSEDIFEAIVGATDSTHYWVLSNLDELDRDTVPDSERAPGEGDIVYNLRKYASVGWHVVVSLAFAAVQPALVVMSTSPGT